MTRSEFPQKVRKAAWDRAGGKCECCGQPFGKHPKDRPHYDHILPDYLGGTPTLDNCMVLRFSCHVAKTAEKDTPHIVKARRGEKKRRGLERRKALIPGSKGSGFRKKMDGTVVRVKE